MTSITQDATQAKAGASFIHDYGAISRRDELPTPAALWQAFPPPPAVGQFVLRARRQIRDIMDGRDYRLLVVVGPCSIHDPSAALEYALRLSELAAEVRDRLLLAMRVYLEKPRTISGLALSRRLLTSIAWLELPAATEAVDPIANRYLQDLISWTAIGARTVESQPHREFASGLLSPAGFKNGTSGDLRVSCRQPHRFLGIDATGRVAKLQTRGNPDTHIVLRGGEARKRWEQQPAVIEDAVNHLAAGNQALSGTATSLRYGASITDPCLDFDATEQSLLAMRRQLRPVLANRAAASTRPRSFVNQAKHAVQAALPDWPDTYLARLQILALLQTLNAGILAGGSATAALESWCRTHGFDEAPGIVAQRVTGLPMPVLTAEERQRLLHVPPDAEVKYRRVQLRCGRRILSEADNWYVPGRLTPEMNQLLETTDTPFGKIVQPLAPHRRPLEVKWLWSPLPEGWQSTSGATPGAAVLAIPDALLRHRAVLYPGSSLLPVALVRETYRRELLPSPPHQARS